MAHVDRRYWWVSFLLCSAIWLGCAGCAIGEMEYFVNGKAVPGSTYESYKKMSTAVSLMKQNDTRAAIAQLERSLQLNPTLSEAHAMLGIALARLGKTEEAALQLRLAIVDNDKLLLPRMNLATIYQTSGQLSEALDMYDAILLQFPESKQVAAVKERADLLRKELQGEKDARRQHGTDHDGTYYVNATSQGRKLWPASQMPIRVYIASGEGLTDYKPEYDSILRQSFDEWQQHSSGKVRFIFVKNPSDAQISCSWVDDQEPMESSAECGEASIKALSESMVKVHIMLSLVDDGAFPLTDNLVRVVALHEIGHSLGLLGHSVHPDDVMFCTAPIVDVERHLSQRDVNTLAQLYSHDVDYLSDGLARLEKETHGNAIGALRFIIILLTIVVVAFIFAIWLLKKGLGQAAKRSKRTSS